jgi:hypothetical protein
MKQAYASMEAGNLVDARERAAFAQVKCVHAYLCVNNLEHARCKICIHPMDACIHAYIHIYVCIPTYIRRVGRNMYIYTYVYIHTCMHTHLCTAHEAKRMFLMTWDEEMNFGAR